MMGRQETVEYIEQFKVIAVLRLPDARLFDPVVEALYEGGIRIVEITMTTPGALDLLRRSSAGGSSELLLGMGSVIDATTAEKALDAGAAFVVSPILREEVVRTAQSRGAAVIPGALTPTEIQTAWEYGADIVKVFPADAVGMGYFSAVRAPLPHLKLVPTGGVTLTNGGEWLRAGACAVGIGGALVGRDLLERGDFDQIRRNAEMVTTAVGSNVGSGAAR